MNGMRDAVTEGNGAVAIDTPLHNGDSMADHGRRIQRDAVTLATEIRGTTADLERYLSDQIEKRPYVALGVAAGVGYILGGGLRSRLTAVVLGTASRLVTALAARELGSRISPQSFTSNSNASPEPAARPAKEPS